MQFKVLYSPDTEEHLRALTARQRTTVMDGIDKRLGSQPTIETRNRKPMRPNHLAPWELRIGELRVYYDVQIEPEPIVFIRAIGIKEDNHVRVGGVIIEL